MTCTDKRLLVFVSIFPVLLIFLGCGGGGASEAPPPGRPSFTVSVSPSTSQTNPVGVKIGTAGSSITVSVVGKDGFSGTVDFSISGLAAGISAMPSTWKQQANQSQEVVFAATAAAQSGPAGASVKGISGSLTANASVFLNIDSFITQDVDSNGGTISVTDPTSPLFGVTLEIPPNALQSMVHVGINPEPNPPAIPGTLASIGVDLRPSGLELNAPAYLSVPYPDVDSDGLVDDATNTGIEPEFLLMHSYDATSGLWVHVPGVADTNAHKVKAELWHFSLYRWVHGRFPDNSTVTYAFAELPTNRAPGITDDQVKEAVRRALLTWERQLVPSGISFAEVEPTASPQITFGWHDPGRFVRFLDYFGMELVGHTLRPPFSSNITITFYDSLTFTTFDGSTKTFTWTTDASQTAGTWNVEAVAVHEIGHALGLEHACECQQLSPTDNNVKAVMNAHADPSQPVLSLFTRDIQAYRDMYGLMYAESGPGAFNASALYTVNPTTTGADTFVSYIQNPDGSFPLITDIALLPRTLAYNGQCCVLFGGSYDTLYIIDPTSGTTVLWGPFGVNDVNALAFDEKGTLYAATVSGNLLKINLETGTVSVVGAMGFGSSGDLGFFGFFGKPPVYATTYDPAGGNDVLVTVDPLTGVATRVALSGDLGFNAVYGLGFASTPYLPETRFSFVKRKMVGITADKELLEIDPDTGNGALLRNLSFSAWGGSNKPN